jgi:peptidoglycan hydrolase-like protein with peptidoglycan-binding domain
MSIFKRPCVLAASALLAGFLLFYGGTRADAAAVLRYSSSGAQVSTLQQNLKTLGYFTYGSITGYSVQ